MENCTGYRPRPISGAAKLEKKQLIDTAAYLRSIEPYQALDPELFDRLVTCARVQRVERGQRLFEQGEVCCGVHVVVSGQLKLAFSSPQGVEKVIGVATPGEGVGETCMSLAQKYPMNAEALSDTTLIFLPRHVLFDCLEMHRGFSYCLMTRIAEKLHGLLLDIEAISLLSGTERILSFLMLHIPDDADRSGGAVIDLDLPKGVIASRLSLTQEHFSRLLRQLSEHGMIIVDGRQIHIPDIARLRSYLDAGAAHRANRDGHSSGPGRVGWQRLAVA